MTKYYQKILEKNGPIAKKYHIGIKWKKTTEYTGSNFEGKTIWRAGTAITVYRNGDFIIFKPHLYAFALYAGGHYICDFDKFGDAKKFAEENGIKAE